MSDLIERELGWDDQIENDGPEFTVLPDGDYDFEVIDFERGRHNGSAKLPPCNKAIVHIKIEGKEGITIIKHNLFLHSSTEGMLCAFFSAIGQRQKGEKIKMNWNAVVGSKGKCKIFIDKWTNDEGREFEGNKIKKFYESAEKAPMTEQRSFQAGKF